MEKGIICKAPEKGYCFIRSQIGERIFVHVNNVDRELFNQLTKGTKVLFECEELDKGKSAIKVTFDTSTDLCEKRIDFSEQQIRELFGDLAAEDEDKERFSSYFIKTDVYQKIHNFLPIRILVAHKGIGKSAVFRMSYLENLKDNVLSIWVKPDDILRLANSKDDVDPLELIRQWKSGLEELLVEKIISNFDVSNENDVINQMSRKGLKLAERIGLIVKKVQDVVEIDEIKKSIAEQYLKNHKIVVYVDDLDRAWNGSRQNISRETLINSCISS